MIIIVNFSGIQVKHGYVELNGVWYHQNCSIFVYNKKNKCEWCERLQNILRAKKHYKELCLRKQSSKQLGPSLTPMSKKTLLSINKKG